MLGSAVSLAYYLRVVAAIWMRPAPGAAPAATGPSATGAQPVLAGGSPELDERSGPHVEVVAVAVLAAVATIVAGVFPGPLFDVVSEVGASLGGLL